MTDGPISVRRLAGLCNELVGFPVSEINSRIFLSLEKKDAIQITKYEISICLVDVSYLENNIGIDFVLFRQGTVNLVGL